jgi:hypothetical protein
MTMPALLLVYTYYMCRGVHKAVDATSVNSVKSFAVGDVLSMEQVDPVLTAKMHLVNNVCEELAQNPETR